MAENKKSFILYCDLIHMVKKLPEKTQAALFVLILEYVNDLNPEINDDILLEVAFEPIKHQLKRDLKRYEAFIIKQSYNGKQGGRPPKPKPKKEKPKNPSLSYKTQKSLNDTVTVNDTDTVIVTDIENVDEEKKGGTLSPSSARKNINQLSKEFIEDSERKNLALKTLSITEPKLTELMIEFVQHLQLSKDTAKSETDFAKHFISYSRIKLSHKSNGINKKHIGASANIEQATNPEQFRFIKRSSGT